MSKKNKETVTSAGDIKEKRKKKQKQQEENVIPGLVKPMWRRVLRIVIPIVLVVVIITILLTVAFGDPNDLKFSDKGIVVTNPQEPDTSKGIHGQLLSDSGMTMFADNGVLQLGYSPKDDLFIVIDKATGDVFRSYPEPIHEGTVDALGNPVESDLASYALSTETGQILTSPVFIGFTRSGEDGGFVKGINQMSQVTKTVYFIDNGVQLLYEVGELQLRFVVEITIDGSALKYKIPRGGIVERETVRGEKEDRRPLLASLAVLPYMGAHRNGDTGYFVVPDGSGALTYFDVPRVANYNEYSKNVYGIDTMFDTLTEPDLSSENLSICSYGIVDDNYMMTSFIDSGESNAALKIGNPGVKNLPFYSIYYQYNYRYYYRMQVSKAGAQYDLIVKDMQIGDVEQTIYLNTNPSFTQSDTAETAYTYYDVALKTRELLLEKWSNQWGVSKETLTDPSAPMNVRFFMGAKTAYGGVLGEMKVMTRFDDVQDIYGEMEAAGASDLRLSLIGWTKNGYFWNSTTKNTPAGDFGGKKGLKRLNAWANEKNLELSLDNNLLVIYGSPSGLNGASLRNSVVKKPNTFYLQYYANTTYGRFWQAGYVMSPAYFENKVMKGSINRLESYGTNSVTLQQLGDMLYTDYNEENGRLRLQVMQSYVDWIKKYSSSFDNVSVYYGFDYAVAVADTIDNIPMNKSSHILFDEEIPFLQIVYHGLVNYYAAPINNQDSEWYSVLKAVEYGANISYEVTEENIADLKYTNYDVIFKAEFDLLKEDMLATYQVAEEAIKPFATQQISKHYRVQDSAEIFCTEYSGGARVYVNYTDTPYTLENGAVVAAMNYLVVNG